MSLFHSRRDQADRAFALLDTDRDGLLDASELCAAVPEAGARAWGLRRIAHLVPRFDGDGDRKLDSGEFAQLNPTGFFLAAKSSVTLKVEDPASCNHLVRAQPRRRTVSCPAGSPLFLALR